MKYLKHEKYLIIILISFIGFSCGDPKFNLEKEKENIINADLEFSKMSEKEGMKKAFLFFADEDAVLLRENSLPIEGKTKIGKSFTGFSDTDFTLIWNPIKVFISESKDLGYTYGSFTSFNKNDTSENRGTYLTIWKKQEDGTWKWVLDTGNEGLGNKKNLKFKE